MTSATLWNAMVGATLLAAGSEEALPAYLRRWPVRVGDTLSIGTTPVVASVTLRPGEALGWSATLEDGIPVYDVTIQGRSS